MIDDPAHKRVRFEGGRLQLFGIDLPLLPIFDISRGSGGGKRLAGARNQHFDPQGLEVAAALSLADRPQPRPDADPAPLHRRACRRSRPNIASSTALGAFQLGGFLTYGTIENVDPDSDVDAATAFRGYFEANGKCQLNPLWSITSVAPGRQRQDRHPPLRHHQRRPPAQFRQCRADYARHLHHHRRLGVPGPSRRRRAEADPDRAAGDRRPLPPRRTWPAALSSSRPTASSILRIEGQDTQRAFASARWDLRRLTPWGQEVVLTAYGRGDVYHTNDAASTIVPDLSRHRRLAHPRHRRARGGREMALRRPAVRRHPAARRRGSSWC